MGNYIIYLSEHNIYPSECNIYPSEHNIYLSEHIHTIPYHSACARKPIFTLLVYIFDDIMLMPGLQPLPSALSHHNISVNRRDVPMVNCTWLINIHQQVTRKSAGNHFFQLATTSKFEFMTSFSPK